MFWIALFITAFVAFAQVSEEEFKRDREYLRKVEKRLEEIDQQVRKGKVSRELLGELNSYGYPLHTLKNKYITEEDKQKFYSRINEAYEKVLYIKRGAFPTVLKKEFENLKIPFCKVEAQGKRRETLTIGIENPKDEEVVMKIMTQTQLRYAHLIGLESLKFEKCR